jgi:hypothetical protein
MSLVFPAQPYQDRPRRGLQIIHAGLFRTGTASMAAAYRILGYRAHHVLDDVWSNPWEQAEAAADATWSGDASKRRPYTRADWDALFGDQYDVVTDLACPFAVELIAAYPNAKVVIVERVYESWLPSFETEVLPNIFPRGAWLVALICRHLFHTRSADCMRKMLCGLFDAPDKEGVRANARAGYESYYRRVREAVPPERRLEYRLGDGWEPLCQFLGESVPDVPFPHINDQVAHARAVDQQGIDLMKGAARNLAPWCTGVCALLIGWFFFTMT